MPDAGSVVLSALPLAGPDAGHGGLGCADVEALLADANFEVERLRALLSDAESKVRAGALNLAASREQNEVALSEVMQSRGSRMVAADAVVEVVLTRADIERFVVENGGSAFCSPVAVDVVLRGDRLQDEVASHVRDRVLLFLAVARDTGSY